MRTAPKEGSKTKLVKKRKEGKGKNSHFIHQNGDHSVPKGRKQDKS